MELLKAIVKLYIEMCVIYCSTGLVIHAIDKLERYISNRKLKKVKVEPQYNKEEVFEMINKYKYESTQSREEYQKESIESSKELKKKADELDKQVEEFVNECEESRKTGGNK
jgi:hypothetical protein